MRTIEYINDRISKMPNVDKFGTKKEVKELVNVLRDDETLIYITSGYLNGNTWLVTCTDKRIIFLDKGMIYGLKQKEVPLERINSIEHSKGLLLGKITIWDGASQITIENIQKDALPIMVNCINKAIEKLKERNNSNINTVDVAAQLEKFAELKDKGIITEEEFNIQKNKLLNM